MYVITKNKLTNESSDNDYFYIFYISPWCRYFYTRRFSNTYNIFQN